jgi:hypothetical protein
MKCKLQLLISNRNVQGEILNKLTKEWFYRGKLKSLVKETSAMEISLYL